MCREAESVLVSNTPTDTPRTAYDKHHDPAATHGYHGYQSGPGVCPPVDGNAGDSRVRARCDVAGHDLEPGLRAPDRRAIGRSRRHARALAQLLRHAAPDAGRPADPGARRRGRPAASAPGLDTRCRGAPVGRKLVRHAARRQAPLPGRRCQSDLRRARQAERRGPDPARPDRGKAGPARPRAAGHARRPDRPGQPPLLRRNPACGVGARCVSANPCRC